MGGIAPLCQNLAPLRTCEHCMRCDSKTSDVPQSFLTVNFQPLLTIFLNEPLHDHLNLKLSQCKMIMYKSVTREHTTRSSELYANSCYN